MWHPLGRFFYLRRQVKLQMSRFREIEWHVASIFDNPVVGLADQAQFNEAQTVLGDLSEQLVMFAQRNRVATFVLNRLGIDSFNAGRLLAEVADRLGTRNEDRDVNYRAVARLLKFQF
jgi:hypothetical protein